MPYVCERTMDMNIDGLNKALVLAALYNGAKPQGMGFMQFDSKPMTEEEAQVILDRGDNLYFDYLKGRVMKISLKSLDVDTRLYNRDNGMGAAEMVVDALRQTNDANAPDIQSHHHVSTTASVLEFKSRAKK